MSLINLPQWNTTPAQPYQPHQGSWGTYDLGISENIGKLMGRPTTSQGGSNIFGSSQALAPQNNQPTQQVDIGKSLADTNTKDNPQIDYSQNNGSTTQQQTQQQQTQQPSQIDPMQQLINDIFNSTMSGINSQEQNLRSAYPTIQQDINNEYNTSKNTLDTQQQQTNSQLNTQEQQGNQRKEDALTAATRLFNELTTGGQQRFGGASSAGEAYKALAGRELQRNTQQIQTDYSTFMGQVQQARTNLDSQYKNGLLQLEQKKTAALNQAQRYFQNGLAQINSMKSQAEGNKSVQRLQLLQDLRNQVYQINLAEATAKNSIDTYKQQVQDQIDAATSAFTNSYNQAYGANQTFSADTNMNPTTDLTVGQGNGGTNQLAMTGIRSNRPEDQYMMGYVTPSKYDQYGFPSLNA